MTLFLLSNLPAKVSESKHKTHLLLPVRGWLLPLVSQFETIITSRSSCPASEKVTVNFLITTVSPEPFVCLFCGAHGRPDCVSVFLSLSIYLSSWASQASLCWTQLPSWDPLSLFRLSVPHYRCFRSRSSSSSLVCSLCVCVVCPPLVLVVQSSSYPDFSFSRSKSWGKCIFCDFGLCTEKLDLPCHFPQ